jgi:hypothetical protein
MAKSKALPDPRGGHVRIYWEILDSHAWHALSWADIGLYVALRRKLKGTNNGNIEATLGSLRHFGITSSASLSKGLRALQAVGLLAKTRQGGVASGGKLCCLYRFTDVPVLDHPKQGVKATRATDEWKRFRTHAEAREAVRQAHQASLRPATREKRKVQPANHVDSRIESSEQILGSLPEGRTVELVQALNTAESSAMHLQAA